MSDVIIFGMGCFVSVVVASAVGVLFWVAANEPHEGALPDKQASEASPRSQPTSLAPAAATSLESKNPA